MLGKNKDEPKEPVAYVLLSVTDGSIGVSVMLILGKDERPSWPQILKVHKVASRRRLISLFKQRIINLSFRITDSHISGLIAKNRIPPKSLDPLIFRVLTDRSLPPLTPLKPAGSLYLA